MRTRTARSTTTAAFVALLFVIARAAPLDAQTGARRTTDERAATASHASLAMTYGSIALGGLIIATDEAPEAGGVLIAFGYVLGPAIGYAIAGLPGRGAAGAQLRGGAVAGMAGIASANWNCGCDDGVFLFLALGAAGVASMVYDVAIVDDYVRRRGATDVFVSPYVDDARRVGVQLRVATP